MKGLVAKGLVKSYGGRRVVNGVCLYVQPGEVVGLLGPNGAGKSTTFYMLAGIERAEAGKVTLDGVDVTDKRLYRRARRGLAFLPQHRSIFRDLSVEGNLVAVLQLRLRDAEECRRQAKELLEEFQLFHLAGQRASSLSGGEARRLEIARALATNPSYVLLDEPFAGIDPITVAMVQEMVKKLRTKGLGILISDHNVRETLRICNRAYIMNRGEITATGTSQELVENELVRRIYLGEDFRL
ncbi:MAG: LPS export ABC transporter ATP-binding protein [Thermodesulfobacteria bacterium]|nr:LPS export ABC transporter ATP-binding protein [Thermodesulfobacteriota bacterium]